MCTLGCGGGSQLLRFLRFLLGSLALLVAFASFLGGLRLRRGLDGRQRLQAHRHETISTRSTAARARRNKMDPRASKAAALTSSDASGSEPAMTLYTNAVKSAGSNAPTNVAYSFLRGFSATKPGVCGNRTTATTATHEDAIIPRVSP